MAAWLEPETLFPSGHLTWPSTFLVLVFLVFSCCFCVFCFCLFCSCCWLFCELLSLCFVVVLRIVVLISCAFVVSCFLIVIFVVLGVSLVLLSDYEQNIVFSAILVFSGAVLGSKVFIVSILFFYCFLSCLFFQWSWHVLCVYCFFFAKHKTILLLVWNLLSGSFKHAILTKHVHNHPRTRFFCFFFLSIFLCWLFSFPTKRPKQIWFVRKPFFDTSTTCKRYFRTPTHDLWFKAYPKTL